MWIFLCLLIPFLPGSDEISLPSTAMAEIKATLQTMKENGHFKNQDAYVAKRKKLCLEKIEQVSASPRQPEEQLALGDLFRFAGRLNDADRQYQKAAQGEGKSARRGSFLRIFLAIEQEKFGTAIALMRAYRLHYPPTPDQGNYLFHFVKKAARNAFNQNDAALALHLFQEELEALNAKANYHSYQLITELPPLFVELDQVTEGLAYLVNFRDRLNEMASQAKGDLQKKFKQRAKTTQNAWIQLNQIGKKVPKLEFSDSFHTQSASIFPTGKVVLIDFWATWCGPCLEGVPKLRQLYRAHRDQGFEIIGLTGLGENILQKSPNAIATAKSDALTKIRQTIKRFEMSWPILFSNRPLGDTRFGVMSIPTYVLVDRKGIIRYVINENGLDGPLQQKIRQLLAEP